MYGLLRWAMVLLLIGFMVLLFKKGIKKRIFINIIAIILIIMIFVQWDVPFENYLCSFSSIEKVFGYYVSEQDVVVLDTCIGEESGMLIYKNSNTYAKYIAPKAYDGWKIGNSKTYSIECESNIDIYRVIVYKVNNTEDRYVWITVNFVDDIVDITDSKGQQFQSVKYGNHVSYCFYASHDFDYTIIIGGKEYSIKKA